MEKDILHIISAGMMAPSGDNTQPWRFETGPGHIDVYNIPERDTSMYNWGQRPSYIANGAVLENMSIAAAEKGYRLTAKILPSTKQPELVARSYLERGTSSSHPLYESIWKRSTNRRPYRDTLLTADQLDRLHKLSIGDASVVLVTDQERRGALARQLALNERVLFEDKRMHSFFFSRINWSERQDGRRRTGFSIKTLELSPMAKAGFSVFRHYPAMRLLNAVGLSAMVAKTNSSIYATGSAIGAVLLPNRDAANYVSAGRLLQRIWLTVTAMDMHLQPLTGIPLLMNRIADGDGTLSRGHARLVVNTYGEISSLLGIKDGIVAFCFRIGYAEPPSARTPRRDPIIHESTTHLA